LRAPRPAGRREAVDGLVERRRVEAAAVGIGVSFFSLLLGTLSWGAGMLLGLAVAGRWPGVKGASFEDLVA
ncbi:MAG TPA: hypothetical protein VF461_20765, partial [Gemmatimonadaceae bacterium]